jgi:hypothetical protein
MIGEQRGINPPAHVQVELEESERIARLKEACDGAALHFRKATDYQIEAGIILQHFRQRMAYGEWRAWLSRNFPNSFRTAERWMEKARLAAGKKAAAMTCEELSELDREAGRWPLDQSGTKCDTDVAFSNPLNGQAFAISTNRKYCNYCRKHKPRADCKACEQLNAPCAPECDGVPVVGPVQSSPASEKGGDASRPSEANSREPGEDEPEPMDKLAKAAENAKALWTKRTDVTAAIKEVTSADQARCKGSLTSGFEMLQRFARAPYRAIPPATDEVCKKCQQAVLLVTNGETGRRTYINHSQGFFPWRLERGGLIVRIPKGQRNGTEHQRHSATCPCAKRHSRA